MNPDWNEEQIASQFQTAGDIMSLHLPRDYDQVPIWIDSEKTVPASLMKFSKRKEKPDNFGGYVSDSLLNNFRLYVLDEVKELRALCSGPKDSRKIHEIFERTHDLWTSVREAKNFFKHEVSEYEKLFESQFNSLVGKSTSEVELSYLENIIKLLKVDAINFVNTYFKSKGYAYITYATRKEAERAIVFSAFFDQGTKDIVSVFDRNIPPHFYSLKPLCEAFFKELYRDKERIGTSVEKAEALMKHHELKFETKIQKQLPYQLYYFGEDQEVDPVVSKKVYDYEEKQNVELAVRNMDNSAGKRREKIIENPETYKRTEIISSDDEFFAIPEETKDNFDWGLGRLNDKRFQITKKLKENYLLSEADLPLHNEAIQKVNQIPEEAGPRQIPPKQLWPKITDKYEVQERIMEVEEFFHEALPSELKENPEFLSLKRIGDQKEPRYFFKPQFNYKKVPQTKELTEEERRKKQIEKDLRAFVTGLKKAPIKSQKEPEADFDSNNELEEFSLLGKKLAYFTDSELEAEFTQELENDPKIAALNKIENPVEYFEKQNEMNQSATTDLLSKTNQSYTKTYEYEGDVEAHVAEIKSKFPEVKADWEVDEEGRKFVILCYKKEFKYNFTEIEKLYRKYEGKIDPEIMEPEDQEIIRKIEGTRFNPEEFCSEMLTQMAEKYMQEEQEKTWNLEDLEKYGPLHQLINKTQEELERNKVTKSFRF